MTSQLGFVCVHVFCGSPPLPPYKMCASIAFFWFLFFVFIFVFCTNHVHKHCVLACVCVKVKVHSHLILQSVVVRDRIVCDAGAGDSICLYFDRICLFFYIRFLFVPTQFPPLPPRDNFSSPPSHKSIVLPSLTNLFLTFIHFFAKVLTHFSFFCRVFSVLLTRFL